LSAASLPRTLPNPYRFPARVSRELLLRQDEQPKPISGIAWKAQVRLCARYRRVARAGKPANGPFGSRLRIPGGKLPGASDRARRVELHLRIPTMSAGHSD
jgi:hypothetical protein